MENDLPPPQSTANTWLKLFSLLKRIHGFGHLLLPGSSPVAGSLFVGPKMPDHNESQIHDEYGDHQVIQNRQPVAFGQEYFAAPERKGQPQQQTLDPLFQTTRQAELESDEGYSDKNEGQGTEALVIQVVIKAMPDVTTPHSPKTQHRDREKKQAQDAKNKFHDSALAFSAPHSAFRGETIIKSENTCRAASEGDAAAL
jgi:hypothetical protein